MKRTPYPIAELNGRTKFTITPEALGSTEFKQAYGIKYAYLSGSMYRAVASRQLLAVAMGKANLLVFFGTGGLSLWQIEKSIQYIQEKLETNQAYGMNLLHNFHSQQMEMDTVTLHLRYGVSCIEASGFSQMSPALVHYRLKGLKRSASGDIDTPNKNCRKATFTIPITRRRAALLNQTAGTNHNQT